MIVREKKRRGRRDKERGWGVGRRLGETDGEREGMDDGDLGKEEEER